MKRYLHYCMVLMVMIVLMGGAGGCTPKKANTGSIATVSAPAIPDSHELAVQTAPDLPATPTPVPTKTMADLVAGFKYVKASYAAIQSALEQLKQYDLGDYTTILNKIYPYIVQLGAAITTFDTALNSSDSTSALNAYNVARPLITTCLKVGGPLLLKMLF